MSLGILPRNAIALVTLVTLVALAAACAIGYIALRTPSPSPSAHANASRHFDATYAMVPMRDGVKLDTVIFVPKATHPPLPFLFKRTPYGITQSDKEPGARGRPSDEIMADGYIWVEQNIRGRFKSEGTFVMGRPPRDRSDPKAIDESTDAYDTIEWLLRNVPGNNGRVGMIGGSYDAWTQVMALLDPHPALRAVNEAASPSDLFLNDDTHHNGAFRLSYSFEYAAMMETVKDANSNFAFDRADTYDW
ncbi:MAG TPA: CocE/NonD family hydrolase, partial [Polyangiaceae bacterium]|nr:CocE/NonD family hydrolase [Polyangiaceae bacterium]